MPNRLERQVRVVHHVLQSRCQDVPPVLGVLCFAGASWPLFHQPLKIRETMVLWPTALAEHVTSPGPLGEAEVIGVADFLSKVLPAGVARPFHRNLQQRATNCRQTELTAHLHGGLRTVPRAR